MVMVDLASFKFVGLSIRRYDTLPISVLVDLVTLTFYLGGHGACLVFVLPLCTKFELCRPSRSENVAHLLCEH